MGPPSKWLKLARSVLRSNVERLQRPYKLTFVTTKECHSRCETCEIWKVRPKGELRLDEIERFVAAAPYFAWVDFTGGEPTDRADLPDVVERFVRGSDNLLLVHFPTNGLKPGRIERVAREIAAIAREAYFVVTVSVDGPPEVHDRLRGVPGNFDRCVDTLERLHRLTGVDVYAGMTLHRDNAGLVDATVQALDKRLPWLDHRRLHVNVAHSSEHYYEAQVDRGQSRELVRAVRALSSKRGVPRSPMDALEKLYLAQVARYVDSDRTPVPCASLLSTVFLSETGVVYPCSIWDKPLGNIRSHDYDLGRVLDAAYARQAREQVRQGDCPHCWTPCEAYPSLAANLPEVARVLPRALTNAGT